MGLFLSIKILCKMHIWSFEGVFPVFGKYPLGTIYGHWKQISASEPQPD
jgi:hypothetical protein